MPRQDVPYGGAICRLKERIAEIWDKLGEKLHTINGVPGDGDGNVKIVSGSSAVVINNDPTQNEIKVSLDTSQLPAASVSSVNGQTGAVALDAGDIPTVGGDVQADLQDLANDISGNTAAINAEVLARQGADATLQTNINAVSASIPSQVVEAVAADPTIALLVSADNDNVKLTGNQSIGGIKTVSTEVTGTYSQQIANSLKVRNEIANLAIMQTGNQNILGNKTHENGLLGQYYAGGSGSANTNRWFYVSFKGNITQFLKMYVANYINNGNSKIIEACMFWNGSKVQAAAYLKIFGVAYNVLSDNIKLTIDTDNNFTLWFYAPAYHSIMINIEAARSWNNNMVASINYVDNPDWSLYEIINRVFVQ